VISIARDGLREEGEMPKESVYGEQFPNLETEPDPNPMVPLVDVLWGKETGAVQIVTKATDPHGGRWAGDNPETHFTDGLFVDLDRKSINQLIRNLRRARDQAFGRDE